MFAVAMNVFLLALVSPRCEARRWVERAAVVA